MFSSSFGSASSSPANPYPLSTPTSVAVDQATGDVYVADPGNDWVEKFDGSGNLIWIRGKAVDQTTGGDLCTVASGDMCQKGTAGSAPGQWTTPMFVAVDNSGDASDGDAYVGDAGDDLVTKLAPDGSVISGWGDQSPQNGQLAGDAAPAGPFGIVAGVTVDPSGNLWVYDRNSHMFEFGQDSSPTACAPATTCNDWNSGVGAVQSGIALDASGNVYLVAGSGQLLAYGTSGGEEGGVSDDNSGAPITGVTVDPATGDLYADDSGSQVRHYLASDLASCEAGGNCQAADVFGSGRLSGAAAGLAYDSSGNAYVADRGDYDVFARESLPDVSTGEASNESATGATVSGTVNPNDTTISDCHFDYGTDQSYGQTAACSPTPTGSSPVTVTAELSSLTPDTTYHYQLEATNSSRTVTGGDQTFYTSTAPTVDAEQTSSVQLTGSTLDAQINPQGLDTTYHVDYGTSTSYGQRTPESDSIGSGISDVPVTENLGGLTAATTYHYRFVATNSDGTTNGSDQTFTTYPPPSTGSETCTNARPGYSAYLPDCRAYEQVSPLNTDGASVEGSPGLVQASSTGNSIAYFTNQDLPGAAGAQDWPFELSSRSSDAWSTQGLLPPATDGNFAGVLGWTPDQSESFVRTSSGQGNVTMYERDDSNGSLTQIASVPPDNGNASFHLDDTTADGSKVLFELKDATLTAGAAAGQDNVYEWDRTAGDVALVGVLPDGSTPAAGSFAGPYDWQQGNTGAGGAESGNEYLLADTLSADGSKAFFTAGGTGSLYMRENPMASDATTVEVSASQKTNGSGPNGTDPDGPEPAAFMGATSDGSRVFFMSSEELTNDANTGSADQGADLYEYDTATGGLADLTPDSNPADTSGAGVQGVAGISQDGSYVYFVANGVLAPGAPEGSCIGGPQTGIATSGQCNLYVWHNGTTRFVAQLGASTSGSDQEDWAGAVYWYVAQFAQGRTAEVSPDGQTLLFMSDASLTDYQHPGAAEVYLYRAGTGQLTCVSCDPSGAAPLGSASLQSMRPALGSGQVPSTLAYLAQANNLAANGNEVFFETPDPLVARDTNGLEGCGPDAYGVDTCLDVYEWEADGTGSCNSTAQNGGCLFLISTGQSGDQSYFADASPSGNDVFIYTDQPLVAEDQGGQLYAIYDVRVDGGIAAQNASAPASCSSSAGCEGELPPPPSGPPLGGTLTFSGPGDQTSGNGAQARQVRVRVARTAINGRRFALEVRIPARGWIRVSGRDVVAVDRSMKRAGAHSLSIRLSPTAARVLRHEHRLRVSVRVAYTPRGGVTSVASMTLAVRS